MDNTTQQAQAQAQREALFDRMIQLGKETESLFEKIEDIEKEIELSDEEKSKSTFLKTLNMEHKICMRKKDELIKNILGQLYTGVLVTDKITIRKGGLYHYKKQRWNVELPNFKKVVLENLHEVSNKLSSENLDILEFLLNKIIPADYDDNDTDEKIISIPITPPIKMVKSEKWASSQEINILLTDSISIDSSGEASFRFLNEQCTGIPSNIERLITLKYKKQIDNATNEKTTNIQQKINSVNKDIEEIKDKGQNYLALIELQKQPQEQGEYIWLD